MAQSNSSISGKVLDEGGEGLVNWPVKIYQGGREVTTVYTDDDGEFLAKPLSANSYEVRVENNSVTRSVQNIDLGLSEDRKVTIDFRTSPNSGVTTNTTVVVTVSRSKPVLKQNNTFTLSAEDLENRSSFNISDAVSTGPSFYQNRSGGTLYAAGARGDGNTYIVDGIVLAPGDNRFTNQPLGSVQQVQAMTGGVSARYGDVSGAVIAITTKGSTDRIRGNVTADHSVDGYNQNQVNFNFTGPLFKRRVRDTSGNIIKTGPDYDVEGKPIAGTGGKDSMVPAVGFVINGQGIYNQEQNPVYNKTTVLRPEALAELQAHPLRQVSTGAGASYLANAADYVTEDQLMQQKRQPNNSYYNGRLNGKLDYALNDNIQLNANGFFAYTRSKSGTRSSFLFAPENQSTTNLVTGRGSLRFTQKFTNDTAKHGFGLQNAFYTVQADFIRDYSESQDDRHKKNTFDYGYVGKFEERFSPVYVTAVDPITQKTGTLLVGYARTGVDFTPSDKNPLAANYTSEYYRLSSFAPTSLNQIQGRGLRNGDNPPSVYSLYGNIASFRTGWSKSRDDQFAIAVDASFDYVQHSKVRHAVEFGLYYQQRSERNYGINAAALWPLMRQLSQSVVGPSDLDPGSGQYIVGGRIYDSVAINRGTVLFGPTDTVKYNRLFNTANQGSFDSSLRVLYSHDHNSKSTDYINIDALDPSSFSVSMFSADELLNNGQNLVSYTGYDYLGNVQTGQVNFNDFWTKKDSRGYALRPIAAFRPNYIAGYLSDYITYKDFKMTLGVRLERYDANTKVLKDPYSLYATRKATSDNASLNSLNGGSHPANINSDYVAYVNDGLSRSASIIGYRNGDNWYDYSGKLLEDPRVLKDYSGGRDPQPLIDTGTGFHRITDDKYDVNGAFTDYKPAVNVSPRINFTFPIASKIVADQLVEKAYFFAHYDLLVQRPIFGANATQVDYLSIQQNGQVTIGNPNLRPQKTFDYQLGFSTQLTQNSGLTITAYYKERKDMIAYRPYLYAYPNTYYTYGNRDFSTTKGLTLTYELQRTGPLSMTLAYTLQFAEGTGSNANSATTLLQNFISAGLPNLRYVTPLSYDSRHTINLNLDYRYISVDGVKGRGPELFGGHPFENAGINATGRIRSGEPYTRYQEAQTVLGGVNVSHTINGGINSARLPWHYWLEARVDKSFTLPVGRNKGLSLYNKRRFGGLTMNAYVRVLNVLNTRDVLSVYGYTGSASDDGYLTSVSGMNTINNQQNPSTFVNLYQIAANNPGLLNTPRQIIIGLQVFF